MPTRKANKIIEAAKGPADLKKMSEILRTMRDLAPDSAASRSKKKGS